MTATTHRAPAVRADIFRDGAIQAVEDGRADAVDFGCCFIANPDLR